MSALVPNASLPPRITAGDALTWAVQTSLPAGSLLFYVLNGLSGGQPVRLRMGGDGVPAGDDGVASFALSSADTAAFGPGRYNWTLFSAVEGQRSEVATGSVSIAPDPAGATAIDTRTRNQRILANINALIEGRSLDDVAMYKIGGRELTKMPVTDLLKWKAIYARKCSRRRLNSVPISFGGGR